MPARLRTSRMTHPAAVAALLGLAGQAWASIPDSVPESASQSQPIEGATALISPDGFDDIALPITPVAGELIFK